MENEEMTGRAPVVTVTESEADPAGLEAVIVYVVVEGMSSMTSEPFPFSPVWGRTSPTEGVMTSEEAPVLDQLKVVEPPAGMEVGVALRVTVGGMSTKTVAVAVTVPEPVVLPVRV